MLLSLFAARTVATRSLRIPLRDQVTPNHKLGATKVEQSLLHPHRSSSSPQFFLSFIHVLPSWRLCGL